MHLTDYVCQMEFLHGDQILASSTTFDGKSRNSECLSWSVPRAIFMDVKLTRVEGVSGSLVYFLGYFERHAWLHDEMLKGYCKPW